MLWRLAPSPSRGSNLVCTPYCEGFGLRDLLLKNELNLAVRPTKGTWANAWKPHLLRPARLLDKPPVSISTLLFRGDRPMARTIGVTAALEGPVLAESLRA